MKRLLLGPALIAPLALFGCSNWGTKVPELPKVEVPEVVRQIPLEDFEHFPPIATTPTPKAPVVKKAPTKPHQVKHHARHVPQPTDRPAPPAPPVVPVEEYPQRGLICIFPFNMIPNCTPGVP